MAFYQSLSTDRNEIRMLKFVDPSNEQHLHLVHCELETVSLDAYTPEFKEFYEKRDIIHTKVHEVTKAWLRECSPTIDTLKKHTVKAQSLIKIPLWRVMEDSHRNNGYGLSDLTPLDYLRDTIVEITSESSQCPSMLQSSPTTLPKQRSLYDGPIPGEDTYFPHIPRFEWGDFEALSYCWETDKLERQMILNNALIDIPKNLEALLQRLKHIPEMKAGMKFWVDALCINQRSVDEKNQQVQLMKDIYSKAFAVIVWLGDDADDNDDAIDFIAASNLWALGDENAWQKWWCRHFEDDPPYLGQIFNERPWKELLQFFSRNYWSRLWIIQEMALNHNMSLFLCGKRQLSRNMISRMCLKSDEDFELIDRHMTQKFGPNNVQGIIDGSVWTTFSRVQNLVTIHGQDPGIDRVLDLARKSNLKDTKDRIYGLLGLLPSSIISQIRPDYKLSQGEVYTQFAKVMLSESNAIDSLLSWCVFENDLIRSCPSWVPNWSTPFVRKHVQWLRQRKAGGSAGTQWSISDDSRQLRIKGKVVDKVKGASKSFFESLSYRSESLEIYHNNERNSPVQDHRYGSEEALTAALRRTLAQDHPSLHPFQVGQGILDIYWIDRSQDRNKDSTRGQASEAMRDITSNSSWEGFDQFRHSNANFSIFGFYFQDFFPRLQGERYIPSAVWSLGLAGSVAHHIDMIEDREYARAVSRDMKLTTLTLSGRKLVTTFNKYLGLAPEAVREGDLIAIIFGCSFPVVLRPEGQSYIVVGECYVDGIMDGEALELRALEGYSSPELVLC